MIFSQFASHAVAEAPPPSTYSSRVGLGGRVTKWLKRAFLSSPGVLQLALIQKAEKPEWNLIAYTEFNIIEGEVGFGM
jgi:hypothetical protein